MTPDAARDDDGDDDEAALRNRMRRRALELFPDPADDGPPPPSAGDGASTRRRRLERDGFLRLRRFASPSDVRATKDAMSALAARWRPGEEAEAFRTDDGQTDAQGNSSYFLRSADRVRFFAEADALDGAGRLKAEHRDDKTSALNKCGHGLHLVPGPFRRHAASPEVRSLASELGWTDPRVAQSMYIFKQPRVGGAVTSHQDSTFLRTEPRETCLGLWLALDDATLENGCLWVRPGSHREPVRRRFERNPERFGGGDGSTDAPMTAFRVADPEGCRAVPWEGGLPENALPAPPADGLFDAGFVPVECEAGDMLVFVGTLDHLSLPNVSDRQRHTFQLHLIEGERAGVTWSKSNWLQYPDGAAFMSIGETSETEEA